MYGFGFVFIYCEAGNQIAGKFDEVDEAFYNLEWDIFPEKIQKMMPIILHVTQQPVQLKAYGNFECSRNTFKKVIAR